MLRFHNIGQASDEILNQLVFECILGVFGNGKLRPILNASQSGPQYLLFLRKFFIWLIGCILFIEIILLAITLSVSTALPANIPQQMSKMSDIVPVMTFELTVLKDVSVLFVANLVEVIHVELSHEGGEVTVPKIGRQDLLLESIHVHYGEVSPLFVPCNYPRVLIVLSDLCGTSRI